MRSYSLCLALVFVSVANSFVPSPVKADTVTLFPIYGSEVDSYESFIRVHNVSTSNVTVTFEIVDDDTGADLGTVKYPIPARAAIQVSMANIEEKSSLQLDGASGSAIYTLRVSGDFDGFVQHIVWNRSGQSLTNLTACTQMASDGGFANNVNTLVTTDIEAYRSQIAIRNTGSSAAPSLRVVDANDGTTIGTWTGESFAAGQQRTISFATIGSEIGFTAKPTQFHVNLELQPGFSGDLVHQVVNIGSGLITQMGVKCKLTGAGSVNLTAGLKAYYALDGNGNDSSGSNQNASNVGSVAFVAGPKGQAAQFNGSNYLRRSGFSGTFGDFTLSAWLARDGYPSDYEMPIAVHSAQVGFTNFGSASIHAFVQKDSAISTHLNAANGGSGSEAQFISPDLPYAWRHFTFIRRGNKLEIWVDGVLKGTNTSETGALTLQNGNFEIGAPNFWGSGDGWQGNRRDTAKWRGLIDEVRLYDRALSAAEIDALSRDGNAAVALPVSTIPSAAGKLTISTATAFHNSGANKATNAIDGSLSTDYNSDGIVYVSGGTTFWWQADLGTARSLTSVRINWPVTNQNKTITIQGSNDGSNFTTLVGSTTFAANGTWRDYTLSGSYRYIRVNLVGSSGTGQGMDITEFEAYGS